MNRPRDGLADCSSTESVETDEELCRREDARRAPPAPRLAWMLLGIVVLVVGGGGFLFVRLIEPPSRGLAPTEVQP
jgi:hypothetical protein